MDVCIAKEKTHMTADMTATFATNWKTSDRKDWRVLICYIWTAFGCLTYSAIWEKRKPVVGHSNLTEMECHRTFLAGFLDYKVGGSIFLWNDSWLLQLLGDTSQEMILSIGSFAVYFLVVSCLACPLTMEIKAEHWCTSTRLCGITCQKIVLFICSVCHLFLACCIPWPRGWSQNVGGLPQDYMTIQLRR